MADFVAVIRRAVDGLTDNKPEMRARVYDKARGAVVRQLENMNPRPPEAMFKRQLDKLDDAIRMVEEEHGEALPAEPSLADPVLADPVPADPLLVVPPSADTMPAAAVPIEEAPSQVDENVRGGAIRNRPCRSRSGAGTASHRGATRPDALRTRRRRGLRRGAGPVRDSVRRSARSRTSAASARAQRRNPSRAGRACRPCRASLCRASLCRASFCRAGVCRAAHGRV